MKLWQKNTDSLKSIVDFTIDQDQKLDISLAPFDILGNLAHAAMLHKIKLLKTDEYKLIQKELISLYHSVQSQGEFIIEDSIEDIHSQIENILTLKLGDVGKKIHAARSRNDQVLVDIKLFYRSFISELISEIKLLFDTLIELSKTYASDLLPGYTHFQLAMPSSFGLWFSAYAESLIDDVESMLAAYTIINKNPLGSAAGYGASFPIDRNLTTELLGFEKMNINVVYAQMSRTKADKCLAQALSNIADTINKLASDITLYMNQNFGFISFPDELTTGSSIMPHKKNPDVIEIIRAKTNQLKSLPNTISLLVGNLPSGYHRDFQLLKNELFPSLNNMKSVIQMMIFMLQNIQIKKGILNKEIYQHLFSVEEVNKLVLQGITFRAAYKQVGIQIENNTFTTDYTLNHCHIGSLGNLCLDEIQSNMSELISTFKFDIWKNKLNELLEV